MSNSEHNSNTKVDFTVADVEKLALLSRLAFTDEEKVSFANEISGILAYVGQIQEVSANAGNDTQHDMQTDRTSKEHYAHKNVMRDDLTSIRIAEGGVEVNALNPVPAVLVDSAPKHTDGYIEVKKIIGGSE